MKLAVGPGDFGLFLAERQHQQKQDGIYAMMAMTTSNSTSEKADESPGQAGGRFVVFN